MDVIGKIYKDYFIKTSLLDGNSHEIKKFELGGICNIITKENFLKRFIDINNLKLQLIINQNIKSKVNSISTVFSINHISVNYPIPSALIFDTPTKRTSYVFDDPMIKIRSFKVKSKSACIFYGDKFYSTTFKKYDQLYLDTAGNSYENLYALSKNKSFKKNSVISISKEYLSNDLLKNFLKEKKYIIISHCPKHTDLYIDNNKVFIPNKYYLNNNEISKSARTTGLGDFFFILISLLNYYDKISLESSIKKAQRIVANYLLSNKKY